MTACADTPEVAAPLDGPSFAAAARAGAPVLDFANLEPIGASTLVRTDAGVSFNLSAALEPGSANTVWVVVFNLPEHCTAPTPVSACGEADLFNPDVMGSVMHGGGTLAGGRARSTVAGHRRAGVAAGNILPGLAAVLDLPVPPDVGLLYPRTAEIHLVVRSHGTAIPGSIRAQSGTFNGGCGGLPAEFGEPGPNECADVGFAVHQ